MKKILVFSFVCLFLLLGNLNSVFALNLDEMDIEKTYLAVCNSPEQIGSLDEVLKVYDLERQWGDRFIYNEGMCWVPGEGVFHLWFGLHKWKEINERKIKIVFPGDEKITTTVDLPSVDYVDKVIRKVVPVTGYIY